jgi:hypothetical protein
MMRGLSEDDLDLAGMTAEELVAAWDLWFDLSQETNDADLPYSHGVFQRCRFALRDAVEEEDPAPARSGARPEKATRQGWPGP